MGTSQHLPTEATLIPECHSILVVVRVSWQSQSFYRDVPSIGGDILCPVIQVYGSLELEDNSEVGDAALDRCSICCVCTGAIYLPANEVEFQLAIWPYRTGFGDKRTKFWMLSSRVLSAKLPGISK